MKFRNPSNNYTEEVATGVTWLWVLLFGIFYWMYKGVWRHVGIILIIVIFTPIALPVEVFYILGAVIWIFYAFACYSIIEAHYNRKGWVRVD